MGAERGRGGSGTGRGREWGGQGRARSFSLIPPTDGYTFYSVSQERFLDDLEQEAEAARARARARAEGAAS